MTLKPAGTGTTMTWALDGDQNFMMKAMSLFMSMDDAVGKDFDQGLAKLKAITEKKAAEAAAAAAAATGPTGPTAATGAAKKPGKKK